MHEGRDKARWAHTAALAAIIANCNRDPRTTPTPYSPNDFNPYVDRAHQAADTIPYDPKLAERILTGRT
jgi:hypothetical protein